jgi:hypothetical protein
VKTLDTEPRQPINDRNYDRVYARVLCKGWWSTSEWMHYEQPAGLVQLAGSGGVSLTAMGNGTQQKIRGHFTTPAGIASWPACKLFLRLSTYGAPADNFSGVLLNSADVGQAWFGLSGPSITRPGWYELVLTAPVTMTPSTLYKIDLSRSGAQDPLNYYRVEMDSTASGQQASFWDGAAWQAWPAPGPGMSLIFKMQGEQDTVTQITNMLAAGAAGQFFSGLDLPGPSGQVTPMWREGRKTARAELEQLFRLGTGSARYLAGVDIGRRLSVFAQPAAGAADYGLLRSGGVLDPFGMPVPLGTCVAGVWLRAVDLAQAAVVGPVMADPTRVFVEAMEWDNLRQAYHISRG